MSYRRVKLHVDVGKSAGEHTVWKDWVYGVMSKYKAAFKTEHVLKWHECIKSHT